MSKTIRISDETYSQLTIIQRVLLDEKDEEHAIISIIQKIVMNADLARLYGIELDDVVLRH